MALPQPSFRKHVFALLGESYGDKTLVLCPTAFVRLFNGDHQAAILLSQILYWSERTQDPEGWFYKSYADWRAETGLSEAQVRRIVSGDPRVRSPQLTLRQLGIETVLKKVRRTGAPTLHYRLHQTQFLAALERLLGQGDPAQCQGSILNIVEDEPCAESGMNAEQCAPSSDLDTKTYTQEKSSEDRSRSTPAHHPDEDSDLDIFRAFEDRFGHLKTSLQAPLRQQLARLGASRVGEVLDRCASRGRSWNYVLKALANEAEADAETQTRVTWPDFVLTGRDGERQPFCEPQQATPALQACERVQTPWNGFGGAAATVLDAWDAAFHQLECQFDRVSFEAWLRGATLVDFEPETTTIVVVVRNPYAAKMLAAVWIEPSNGSSVMSTGSRSTCAISSWTSGESRASR